MKRDIQSRNVEPMARVTVGGLALATVFYELNTGVAVGCKLVGSLGSIVLLMLRPILLVGLQSAQAYLSEHARLLQHLPQIVTAVWTLLGSMAC